MRTLSVRGPGLLGGILLLLLPALGPGSACGDTGGPDASGEVVRRVRFVRNPIFSEADRQRVGWLPLGLANALHVDTRIPIIRRELLFEEGERVDRDLLDECERELRETGIFADARVAAVAVAPDTVDVVVTTWELWTTSADGSYERFKDQALWSLQVRERNLLGTARSLALARDVDEDRASWTLGAGDRQLFGTRWRGQILWTDSDDGEATVWSLERPFLGLHADWSFRWRFQHQGLRPRYYITGTQYIRPHQDLTRAELLVERRVATTEDAVWRVGAGYRHRHQRFNPERDLPVEDAGGDIGLTASLEPDVPENRRLHMPVLVVSRKSRHYLRERFLFAMGRVEDLPLGNELRLQLGWPNEAWESSDSGLFQELQAQWLFRHRSHIHLLTLQTEGLVKGGGGENLQARIAGSSYKSFSPSLRAAMGVLIGISSGLDRQDSFHLGVENGLRAARFRELTGDRLLRGNAELRWVHAPGILGLVTPGATAFFDLGTAWYEEESDLRSRDLRGALGLGLRLGFNRGATEVPIRFDLAWPMLYDVEQEGPILSIGTGQLF